MDISHVHGSDAGIGAKCGMLGTRTEWSRKILEASLEQNGGLLKQRDRTRGQKELLPRGGEGWLIIYYGVGGGEEKGRLQKEFHMLKKTHWIPEVLPLSS